MDFVICVKCGNNFPRYEDGKNEGRLMTFDWSIMTDPTCPACRGLIPVPIPKRDILSGFPWKRDKNGRKVPK